MKNLKNISKKVCLVVALIATVMTYANDGSFFINKKDTGKTVLTLSDVKAGDYFSIKDANGSTLYKETIRKSGVFIKGFNLKALPEGNYTFELEKAMEIKTIAFTIANGTTSFDKANDASVVYKPVTTVKNNTVYMSKLSLNNAPLNVDIYIDEGEYKPYKLIYSETIKKDTKNLERIYKLENPKAHYKIVYKTEGKEFVELL